MSLLMKSQLDFAMQIDALSPAYKQQLKTAMTLEDKQKVLAAAYEQNAKSQKLQAFLTEKTEARAKAKEEGGKGIVGKAAKKLGTSTGGLLAGGAFAGFKGLQAATKEGNILGKGGAGSRGMRSVEMLKRSAARTGGAAPSTAAKAGRFLKGAGSSVAKSGAGKIAGGALKSVSGALKGVVGLLGGFAKVLVGLPIAALTGSTTMLAGGI